MGSDLREYPGRTENMWGAAPGLFLEQARVSPHRVARAIRSFHPPPPLSWVVPALTHVSACIIIQLRVFLMLLIEEKPGGCDTK